MLLNDHQTLHFHEKVNGQKNMAKYVLFLKIYFENFSVTL